MKGPLSRDDIVACIIAVEDRYIGCIHNGEPDRRRWARVYKRLKAMLHKIDSEATT